jgi:hypothetical protein
MQLWEAGMKQSLGFLVVLFAVMCFQLAGAQQALSPQPAPPQTTAEKSTAESSPTTATASQPLPGAPTTNGSIIVNLPNPIRIEGASPGSGGSWSGWLALLGAFVAAAVSWWVGYKTAQSAEEQRSLMRELATQERETKVSLARLELATKEDHFNKEQAEIKRQADLTHSATQLAARNEISIKENQIALELKRLGFQSGEAFLAATRLVHERQVAEAELIRSFSDRLLGESERESWFALFVLSAYVSPEVIARLAAGGEDIISTANLEKLAAINGDQIADVARSIIERRKAVTYI